MAAHQRERHRLRGAGGNADCVESRNRHAGQRRAERVHQRGILHAPSPDQQPLHGSIDEIPLCANDRLHGKGHQRRDEIVVRAALCQRDSRTRASDCSVP